MPTTSIRRHAGCLAAAGALAVAGCASTPDALVQARSAYAEAAAETVVATNAPIELYEARKTLQQAEAAWEDDGDRTETEHLAYLAARRVEIARAAADRKVDQSRIDALAAERDRYLIESRGREADLARERARAALEQAEAARLRVSELERELEEMGARQTERGAVLTLGEVLFAVDRAELQPGAMRNLSRLVDFLKEHPDRNVLIEGHTDDTGSDAYNLELSRRRAASVASFLASHGVAPQRITERGYGFAYPVASNATPAGRQQNRRVDVVILRPGETAEQRALR